MNMTGNCQPRLRVRQFNSSFACDGKNGYTVVYTVVSPDGSLEQSKVLAFTALIAVVVVSRVQIFWIIHFRYS